MEDTSPGVSEVQLNHLFERFYRGESSRNRETGGIGLGLAIGRTIVRSHGGDITVANRDGGGAIFSICLPTEN